MCNMCWKRMFSSVIGGNFSNLIRYSSMACSMPYRILELLRWSWHICWTCSCRNPRASFSQPCQIDGNDEYPKYLKLRKDQNYSLSFIKVAGKVPRAVQVFHVSVSKLFLSCSDTWDLHPKFIFLPKITASAPDIIFMF